MKIKAYGFQSKEGATPIPASVANKYHKNIASVDGAGTDGGKLFYSCRGIAFADPGSDFAQHCFSGTVGEFRKALKSSEECICEVCKREFWGVQ